MEAKHGRWAIYRGHLGILQRRKVQGATIWDVHIVASSRETVKVAAAVNLDECEDAGLRTPEAAGEAVAAVDDAAVASFVAALS